MTGQCNGIRAQGVIEAVVALNERVAEDLFRLRLDAPAWDAADPEPGQFVMLRAGEGTDPLLGRPLGAAGFERKGTGGSLEILYRVVGRGTALFSGWRPGRSVRLLGPLGRGYPLPPSGRRVLLAAGGTGLPPLLFMARRLAQAGRGGEAVLVYGEPTARSAAPVGQWLEGVRVVLATDDGTAGRKGRVTEALADLSPGLDDHICACGPAAMLRAIHARHAGSCASAYFSLEARMACGFGICSGCAVRVRTASGPAYVRACSEGPVFSGDELLEESFAGRV